MPVLPQTTLEQIQFCETHLPVWSASPAAVGLSAGQCTGLNTATGKARASYNAAQAAREASKAATMSLRGDVKPMRNQVGDLIRQIKAYAELQANPATVYAAAQIPAPAPPSPATAPGTPNNITVTLQPSGAITLSWDATDAAAGSGAFFNVERKLPGQTAYTPIGGAPGTSSASRRMSFTDTTVPTTAAGSGVRYIITGQRGALVGKPSDAVVVQFGTGGTGLSVQGGTALSIAA